MATVSEKPWSSITAASYADAGDLCDASLINLNTGPRSTWSKAQCKLPVRLPKAMGGNVNRGGVYAAATVLAGARGGVDAPPAAKKAAARKLVSLYSVDLKQDAPASVVRLAQ